MNLVIQRLTELPSDYQQFVSSSYAREIAKLLGNENELDTKQIDDLETGIQYLLLFFFTLDEFANYLQTTVKLSRDESYNMTNILVHMFPEEFPIYDYNGDTSLTSDILEVEHVLKSLNTVHTMQNDVDQIQQETPIHQSSQDALLQRPDTITQQNPTTPRWDTE